MTYCFYGSILKEVVADKTVKFNNLYSIVRNDIYFIVSMNLKLTDPVNKTVLSSRAKKKT